MLTKLSPKHELYGKDVEAIRAAVRRAEAQDDGQALAIAQDALAHAYGRAGDARRAASIAKAARDLLTPELIDERVMLQNTRLMFEMVAGRHGLVIEMSPAALCDAELLGIPYYRGQAHANLANALKHTGDADGAINHFTAAAVYFEGAGHAEHVARTDNNLAELYARIGDGAQAHEYLDRAERYFTVEQRRARGELAETRAQAFIAEEKFAEAKEAIRVSRSYLSADTDRAALAETVRTEGRIEELTGNTEAAQRCYLEAVELLGGDRC